MSGTVRLLILNLNPILAFTGIAAHFYKQMTVSSYGFPSRVLQIYHAFFSGKNNSRNEQLAVFWVFYCALLMFRKCPTSIRRYLKLKNYDTGRSADIAYTLVLSGSGLLMQDHIKEPDEWIHWFLRCTWSEWSLITHPDPEHPKGTHPNFNHNNFALYL